MSAVAVTGHSTTNLPNDCFTLETGYSAIGAGGRAVNDRLRPGRTGTPDPNLTAGLLQSGPTASHDFSCFASTKRPFVISHTRASADVYGDRVGDGTRLGPVTRRIDLPAPEQSLKVQDGGQQCGNEIDGWGTRPRPQGVFCQRQRPDISTVNLMIYLACRPVKTDGAPRASRQFVS